MVQNNIDTIFFDVGATLRYVVEDPEFAAAAEKELMELVGATESHDDFLKRRMAELAGETDAQAFYDKIEERYRPYRDWALGENKESGDYELWAKWLLPELPEEKLRAICSEMTFQYRQAKGLRHLVEGGREVIHTLHDRGYRLGIISNLIGEKEIGEAGEKDGYGLKPPGLHRTQIHGHSCHSDFEVR